MSNILNGTTTALQIRQELKLACEELNSLHSITPGLAVVLVGSRRDSATYVRMKKKACAEVGVKSIGIDLPVDVTQEELLRNVSIYISMLEYLACWNI